MTKKLSLLKPDKKTIYLENGKGQKVDFLKISKDLRLEDLESDVKAGALQFKECMEFAEKKPSQVVLIECENEEEGLMAASYLAGIYNWKEKVYGQDDLFGDFDPDEFTECGSEEKVERSLEDYRGMQDEFDFNDNLEGYGRGPEEDLYWIESATKMPIIKLSELTEYSHRDSDSIFYQGPIGISGQQNVGNKEPYWLTVKKEPVCILTQLHECYGRWHNEDNSLVKELGRFATNRHVYVVIVDPYLNNKEDDWAYYFGKKLEKRFPKQDIALQIVSMRNPHKSAQMEKVYRYVLNEEHESDTLTKEDFAILKRFQALGMTTKKEETSKKSVEKMETTLVGMENVKRQIHSIVEVLKYNKNRQKMGLGNGGYHNVHLLIGAPGTAKTTVAEMLGNMMCEQNLLPGNRFISINGADLKGMYVGHSAPKTKRYFDEYDIIFIDEAYSLTSERDMDSFSQEAIAQLIIEIEKHGMDKLVMFAGYGGKNVSDKDNKMKMFLDADTMDKDSLAERFWSYRETVLDRELPLEEHAKAVRFMNLHKAKGLEGNIVILTKRNEKMKFRGGAFQKENVYYPALEDDYRRIKWTSYIRLTDILAEAEKEETEEQTRLQYVAATRAKQAFIVMDAMSEECMFTNQAYKFNEDKADRSITSILKKLPIKTPSIPTVKNYVAVTQKVEPQESLSGKWQNEPLYEKYSPSKMEPSLEIGDKDTAKADKPIFVKSKRPKGGVFGTAMHRGLELLIERWRDDFTQNVEQLKPVISVCVNQAVIEGREDIKKNELTDYQEFLSEILTAFAKWAYEEQLFTNANAAEVYTEYNFSYATKDVQANEKGKEAWVNGTADLMLLGKDGSLQIFDYKSNRDDNLTEEQFVFALKETYSGQLALYKKSMARLFKLDEEAITLGIFSFTEKNIPGQVSVRYTPM